MTETNVFFLLKMKMVINYSERKVN